MSSSSSNTPTFQDYLDAAKQAVTGRSVREQRIALGVVGGLLALLLVGVLVGSLTSSSGDKVAASSEPTVDVGDPLAILAPSDGSNGSALALVSGKPLFPLPGSGVLNHSENAPVEIQNANIQEIASGDGFWVGTNYQQRVFVHVPSSAMSKGALSPAALQEGQSINVSGRIQLAPQDPAELGLKDMNASQLLTQTEYVEANSVRQSNG